MNVNTLIMTANHRTMTALWTCSSILTTCIPHTPYAHSSTLFSLELLHFLTLHGLDLSSTCIYFILSSLRAVDRFTGFTPKKSCTIVTNLFLPGVLHLDVIVTLPATAQISGTSAQIQVHAYAPAKVSKS